jgi:sarcosine oxidase
VFEATTPGNLGGSSHGDARIFRLSYPDPFYVALAVRARDEWRSLSAECGEELIRPTGGIDFGSVPFEHNLPALQAAGVAAEEISAEELRRRFPALEAHGPAVFQPDSGVIAADRALEALRRSATARGADVRTEAAVERIERGPAGVRLWLSGGESVETGVVVVAAGAWSAGLLQPLGLELPLRVTRERVAFFPMPREMEVPPIIDWEEPVAYALPTRNGELKCGLDHTGSVVDPSTPVVAEESVPAIVQEIRRYLARRMPSLNASVGRSETCLYSSTPDLDFVIDRRGDVVVVSACSGHGFKFGPLVGKLAASLVTGEGQVLERFSLARFAPGAAQPARVDAWGHRH